MGQAAPLWPLLLPIAGFTAYSIILKTARPDIHPLVFLAVAYAAALMLALAVWRYAPHWGASTLQTRDIFGAALLGAALVTIEAGFLFAFRQGWPMGSAVTITNVATALALLGIGLLFFRERISPTNIAGIALCLVGLLLIAKK